MTYREERTVMLPDGRITEEIRVQTSDGEVNYHYAHRGRVIPLDGLDLEYNGQVIDAVELDE